MKADFSALNAAVEAATVQVAATETVEAGAVALIASIQGSNAEAVAAAVEAALAVDNASDQSVIDAAMGALGAVTSRYTTSAGKLGDALVVNTPAA